MADEDDPIPTLLRRTGDPRLTLRWDYYWGRHPKLYATPKLHEMFRTLADSFTENYCGLAINARLSRLEITGWQGDQGEAAQEVWDRSRLPQYQDRLYRYGLAHSRAYLVADAAEEGPILHIHPATMCWAEPDPDNPFALAWAGKSWKASDGWRITLWYPDRTERYLSSSDKRDNPDGYQLEDEEGNDLGRPPVVEVSPYGDGPPLIDQIAGLQDRINKIASNKFVAAEFGAFRQRVFFTRQQVDPYDLRNAPDHAIVLDPGDPDGQARVQEMSATDLSNYDSAKNAEVDALFTIATLPRHLRVNPGVPPSGEAIKADEGPFVESLEDHQRSMAEALTEAMLMLDLVAEPIWRDPEVHNDQAMAQTTATMVDAGVPWQTAVQMYAGWTEEEVAEARVEATQPTGNAVGSALLNAFAAPTTPTA